MGPDPQLILPADVFASKNAQSPEPDSDQALFAFMQFVPTAPARRASDREVNYNERYCRVLAELAADGIMVLSPEGMILDANGAMCEMFDLPRVAIVGHDIASMPYAANFTHKNFNHSKDLTRGKISIVEHLISRPDGSLVNVEVRAKIMPDGNVHSVHRDISAQKREEKALRESEQRYRHLFELESDAIFLIDNEVGQILEANAAAAALYGYSHDELISMRNTDLSAEPEVTQQATHGVPKMKNGMLVIPLRYHRKADGSVFPTEITARAFTHCGRSVHVAAIRDITQRKRTEDELKNSVEQFRQLSETLEIRVMSRTRELETANVSLARNVTQLRNLAMELTQAEERERKRLALLLHDHLQPFLVAATMKISLLAQSGSSGEQSQLVQQTLDLIKSAISASRSLTMDLYPPILLDAGLMPGLRWLADWIKENYGIAVEIVGDESLEFPESLGILLFQTIRELLFNVAKHSKSEVATVTMEIRDDLTVFAEVADQGVGFPPSNNTFPCPSGGLGLFHLRERLVSLGGSMTVESSIGKGAKVSIAVPIYGRRQEQALNEEFR